MSVRVGIDLVAVDTVEDSLARHASRYLDRVYTPQEQRDCRRSDGTVDAAALAAYFAAKEATLKVLRPNDDAVAWRSIEIQRGRGGGPTLSLSGTAADLACTQGIEEFEVSITREGPFAAAVVLAAVGSQR